MFKKATSLFLLLASPYFVCAIEPQMSEAGKVILEDDYSKPGKNLFVKKNFKVNEGVLQIKDHDPKAHSANSHTKFAHKDYIVSFDLYLEDEKSNFGFFLGGGHGLGLQFTSNKLTIKNGKPKRSNLSLPTKKWLPVMIERVGEELVLQVQDSKSVFYTQGNKLSDPLDAIGIKCFEGTYKMDNVKVWEATKKSGWENLKSKIIKS